VTLVCRSWLLAFYHGPALWQNFALELGTSLNAAAADAEPVAKKLWLTAKELIERQRQASEREAVRAAAALGRLQRVGQHVRSFQLDCSKELFCGLQQGPGGTCMQPPLVACLRPLGSRTLISLHYTGPPHLALTPTANEQLGHELSRFSRLQSLDYNARLSALPPNTPALLAGCAQHLRHLALTTLHPLPPELGPALPLLEQLTCLKICSNGLPPMQALASLLQLRQLRLESRSSVALPSASSAHLPGEEWPPNLAAFPPCLQRYDIIVCQVRLLAWHSQQVWVRFLAGM